MRVVIVGLLVGLMAACTPGGGDDSDVHSSTGVVESETADATTSSRKPSARSPSRDGTEVANEAEEVPLLISVPVTTFVQLSDFICNEPEEFLDTRFLVVNPTSSYIAMNPGYRIIATDAAGSLLWEWDGNIGTELWPEDKIVESMLQVERRRLRLRS